MISYSISVSSSVQMSRKQYKESTSKYKAPVKGEGHDWSDLIPSYRNFFNFLVNALSIFCKFYTHRIEYNFKNFEKNARKILRNISFLGMTGAATADMAFVSIISMYGIQYLSEVYHITHANSSIIFR